MPGGSSWTASTCGPRRASASASIGENGTGKSTLLRLLAGVERPDSGTVQRPGDLAYLPQEPAFEEHATVAAVLADALEPLHAAVRDVERLSAALATRSRRPRGAGPVRAGRLEFAVDHDAWDADRRAAIAAARLGIDGLGRERAVRTLSGGQRTRLAIAAVIATRPWCVLLDEPTNHLDDDAMDLLEEFLLDLPGIVVAASHDRTFLDRVCTVIVDLDAGPLGTDGSGGRRFAGRFSDYLDQQAAARRALGAHVSRAAGRDRRAAAGRARSARRRSRTTAGRGTTTSSSTTSRAARSSRRTPGASRPRGGGWTRRSAARCASRRPPLRVPRSQLDRPAGHHRTRRVHPRSRHPRTRRGAAAGRRRPAARCWSPGRTAPASRACSPRSPAG